MKEPRLEMLSDLFKITHVFVAKIGIEGSPCNLPLPKTCIYPSIKERPSFCGEKLSLIVSREAIPHRL